MCLCLSKSMRGLTRRNVHGLRESGAARVEVDRDADAKFFACNFKFREATFQVQIPGDGNCACREALSPQRTIVAMRISVAERLEANQDRYASLCQGLEN
jgi:hypothetical protein